jgi:hypothetical protein
LPIATAQGNVVERETRATFAVVSQGWL